MSFTASDPYLKAWLDLLGLQIKKQVALKRHTISGATPIDPFTGMYISPEEIDAYLSSSQEATAPSRGQQNKAVKELDQRINKKIDQINHQTQGLTGQEQPSPLIQLKERFQLTDNDIHILICCAAPDIDARFHRLFAYLQDDVNLRRPTLQLLTQLLLALQPSSELLQPQTPLQLRFSSQLWEHYLFDHSFPGSKEDIPVPSRQFKVADHVLDFLLGSPRLDSGLSTFGKLESGNAMQVYASYFDYHIQILQTLLHQHHTLGYMLPSYIGGPEGAGKTKLAATAAHALGKNLLKIDYHQLLSHSNQIPALLAKIRREARLHNAVLLIRTGETIETDSAAHPGQNDHRLLNAFISDNHSFALIFTGIEPYNKVKETLGKGLQSFYIPMPGVDQRYELWSSQLSIDSIKDQTQWLSGLAVKFRFTPGRIRTVLHNAALLARTSEEKREEIDLDELYYCCREESDRGMLAFSQKIKPHYTWDDIVLPPDTLAQLQEICNSIRNRQKVFWEWGFEQKFSLGKGLNVLLAGPPGIGKTMSAEIIANELRLDLYKIDLSCVVSKYIGETEKNLGRIFREAETSNCILFFDEADALFGKRTEVKDSHDRYANIEVNFLLQKMEEYDGIVLLATNMRKNLDAAFTRRLHYVVDFPFPDENLRASIWQRSFPGELPVSPDIDFQFLAGRFKVSGGNIKNVAINSAFLASSNGGKVNMENIILALKREYQKMGKMCSKTEFGQYYSLVKGDSQ